MRDTEKEAETLAEGEEGSLQGTWCGTRSWIPGSCPEPKADAQLLSHPGVPKSCFFFFFNWELTVCLDYAKHITILCLSVKTVTYGIDTISLSQVKDLEHRSLVNMHKVTDLLSGGISAWKVDTRTCVLYFCAILCQRQKRGRVS